MTKTAEKLKDEIIKLSHEDQEAIYDFLGDTLGFESLPDLSDEWLEELDRRVNEMQENPEIGLDGEQVMEELRKKYP